MVFFIWSIIKVKLDIRTTEEFQSFKNKSMYNFINFQHLDGTQTEVEIQYAAVYTECILPLIQCTCSIYCQFSLPYTAAFRVPCIYTAHVSEIAVYDHTAHILLHSSSIPAVHTAELVECTFSVYCNYTSLYCISTALRSGYCTIYSALTLFCGIVFFE